MKRCKECGGKIPNGKSPVSWFCRILRLCLYCYRAKWPVRQYHRPALAYWTERLLSSSERMELERNQFEGCEQELWDKDFLKEWEEYLEAKERGELQI